jgi:23S rRNA (uracil1939-C5)-methyltransferase
MLVLDAAQEKTCAHFGICGGCTCLSNGQAPAAPLLYALELQNKGKRVRELLGAFDVLQWKPILPSPDPWYYRNKMELAFAAEKVPPPPPRRKPGEPPLQRPRDYPDVEGVLLGQREAGRFDRIVDLETCLLMSPETEKLVHLVRAWAQRHGITGYDRHCHRGILRYLVVREGKNTGERMVLLLAGTDLEARWESVRADFQSTVQPLVTTAWLGISDSPSDVARTPHMKLLWGSGTFEERLGSLYFRVSPYSFFQTNTHGAERLYGLLQEWGRNLSGALLDLYCGSGGITLSLAGSFDRVLGIDSNREAIEDAIFNAQRNAVSNAEFITGDAIDFMSKLPASKVAVQLSAVVVDPPRPGLHPKALKALVDLNPPRLAYVSCNPESLARDLQSLVPFYKIQSVQPVDLFPHTPHVETVALLEHR